MVNRPAGGARSEKRERAPDDWYRESPRVVQQLMHGVDFGDDLIWDPCCGGGNVLDVARSYGHPVIGSDIIDRHPRHKFFRGNILSQVTRAPTFPGRATSIISNPPFGDQAEKIIAHILDRYLFRKAAFILPIAFLASQERWRGNKFAGRWRPSQVCFYRERHSMPPGHLVDTMAKPYEGGMADYCALVFTPPHQWRTQAVWLTPGHHPEPPRRRSTTEGEPNG